MIVDDRDRSSTDSPACLGARWGARLPTPDPVRRRPLDLDNADYCSGWTGSVAELLIEYALAVRLPHDQLARRARQGCINQHSTSVQDSRNQDVPQHRGTGATDGDDLIRRGAKEPENDRVRVVTADGDERKSKHPARLRRVEAAAASSAGRGARPVDGDGEGEVDATPEPVALTGDGERPSTRQASVCQLPDGEKPSCAPVAGWVYRRFSMDA
jgi:hypothetical protein